MELLVISMQAVLILLLVYQNWFYTTQIKALVDRLMARNIQEFEQAKNPPPPRKIAMPVPQPMENFDRILG